MTRKLTARLSAIVRTFCLTPASPKPIGVLRVGLASALLFQAWLLGGDLFDLYGSTGIMQGALSGFLHGPPVPNLGRLARWVVPLGLSERGLIIGVFSLYVSSLVVLLLGIRPRAAATVTWATHMLLMSGHVATYGVDSFAHIFLFYLMWMPSGLTDSPSPEARLALRVIQFHLCIVYFASGVEKAAGVQWRDGEAIWRSLNLPLYSQYDFSWLAEHPWLAKLGAWGTLVAEIGYPFFIWSEKTRKPWVALIVGLHVGIAILLGLHTFGFVMSVLTFAAFGVSATPGLPARVRRPAFFSESYLTQLRKEQPA